MVPVITHVTKQKWNKEGMISLQSMQYFILAICKLFSVDIQNLYLII